MNNQKSPFTRPGFIIAAGVIVLIVVLGIIGVINATRANTDTQPSTSPSPSASSAMPSREASTAAPATDGPCGQPEAVGGKTLSLAPKTSWEYQGTTAYPTSAEFGPYKSDPSGFRYCFQRSPTGAVLAAANAAVHATDPAIMKEWFPYFVTGPDREKLLASPSETTSGVGARIGIAGFRVLAYDGQSARINVALRGTVNAKTTYISMVYSLGWVDGDWKLNVTDAKRPIDVAVIPDLGGYIRWSA